MKRTVDKVLFQIENEIESKSINEDITIDIALYMVEFIRPLFEELRTFIAKYKFQDKDEEILFFKNIKPTILSKLLYFNHIYVIELRKPSGGIDSIKDYYKERLASITNFFNANLDFYQYYRSKASHLDKYYFLRGRENYKLCHGCGMFDKDPLFSTCYDHKVAKILAYDMLEIYLEQKLQSINKQAIVEKSRASLPDNPFRWTGTKIAAIELGYAIYAAEVLNNGNADIKEIMTYIEASFKIDLGDYYRTYLTIRERKKDKTSFLTNLINKLLRKMDEDDKL